MKEVRGKKGQGGKKKGPTKPEVGKKIGIRSQTKEKVRQKKRTCNKKKQGQEEEKRGR